MVLLTAAEIATREGGREGGREEKDAWERRGGEVRTGRGRRMRGKGERERDEVRIGEGRRMRGREGERGKIEGETEVEKKSE